MYEDLSAPPPTMRGLYPPDAGRMLSLAWDIVKVQGLVAVGGMLLLSLATGVVTLPFSFGEAFLRGFGEAMSQQGEQDTGAMLLTAALVVQLIGIPFQLVASAFTQLGIARGSYTLVTSDEPSIGAFFPLDFGLLLKGVLAQLALGFVVFAGLCLFIVPGIIAGIGLQMWPWAMVVERRGVIESLQRSWELTDGLKLQLFLYSVLTGILALLALLLTCGLGLLLVMPLYTLGVAAVFEGARAEEQGLPSRA